ncbi:MAG: type II toxin-antitoxin system RelE/ParE family toxin [Nanoarchaeota archaeon]
MVKTIVRAPRFVQQINKLDKSYLERIQKLIAKIINNPDIGKPMRFDRKGTREVYVSPFRLSYTYNNEMDMLYLLDIYHKDVQ